MDDKFTEFAVTYRNALRESLGESGEPVLARAYNLGRNALERGIGLLHIFRIHEDALSSISEGVTEQYAVDTIRSTASKFFAECLSPYEMTQRGFQEAMATIRKRAEELVVTNARLIDEVRERKQAEFALRESEERYRKLIESARDVIYTLSTEGRITSINPAFEEVTGWLRSEWLGKPFAPLVHPDDVELAMLMFKRVLEGDTPSIYEVRIASKSGRFLVGEFVTTPQIRGGKIVGVLGIGRDVTSRKQAEERLREHEELFRAITDNTIDLIAILDTTGKRVYASPSYRSLLGEAEALIGSDSFANIHPEDRERIRATFESVIATQVGQRETYRIDSIAGSERYMESQWNVVRTSSGVVDRIVKVSRDITERKLAHEELQRRERQLADAQQLAHIGSWEWDMKSGTVTWSDEMCRIYGLNPDTFNGSPEEVVNGFHPDDRERIRAIIGRARTSRTPFRYEHRVVQPSGDIRMVEVRGEVILDAHGEVKTMVGTAQDITEWKKTNEAVQKLATRVVEAEEQERQRIARELHDNVCQKLSATKMRLETLETKVGSRNHAFLRDLVNGRKEVGHMVDEIRRISANLRPTALDDLGLVSALQVLAREFSKSSSLKVEFRADPAPANRMDINVELAILRIAQEALTNVVRHARAKHVTVSLAARNGTIGLTVKDDGRGFDHNAPRRRNGLGGIGLVNMQERATLVGGNLLLETIPKKGTTIHVEIPVRVNHEKN